MTMHDVRHLLAVLPNWVRRHPDDEWAADFAEHVPPLVDELDAARAALVEVLGSEGAQPLGGLAAGIRKLAEQRGSRWDDLPRPWVGPCIAPDGFGDDCGRADCPMHGDREPVGSVGE